MIRYGKQWEVLQDYFAFEETANSALWTPGPNEAWVYSKDKSGVSGLYWKNDAGTEYDLGLLTAASGAANRVAIWTSATALGSDADLTFVTDTLTATKLVVPTLATFTLAATFSFLTATRIPFAGTAGALSDDSKLNWDNTNKRLGIGTTSPTNIVEIADTVVTATRGLRVSQYSADAQFANIAGAKSRSGTIGTQAAVVADDGLVQLAGFGSDGSSFGSAQGAVQINAAENWSGSAKGTYIKFANCPTGSTTTAERFRMGPAGQWGIGGATYGTALDVFTSGGSAAAPTWTTPGALSKVDDTNVTLTLGGTPLTALLRAASLTLGWTGTLAVARGGTGLSSISGDWLSQYALLAGRSGGQTLTGGTAAADDLILKATSGNGVGSESIQFLVGNNGATEAMVISKTATELIRIGPTQSTIANLGIGKSITTSSSFARSFYVYSTFDGAGDEPAGADIFPTFTPSANITNAHGIVTAAVGNPASGVTITQLRAGYWSCWYRGDDGAVTNGITAFIAAPDIGGALKPTGQYGVHIDNQGRSGITTSVGLQIIKPTGSTNNYYIALDTADATDPTGGGGAAVGRIPIVVAGVLRYLPYY